MVDSPKAAFIQVILVDPLSRYLRGTCVGRTVLSRSVPDDYQKSEKTRRKIVKTAYFILQKSHSGNAPVSIKSYRCSKLKWGPSNCDLQFHRNQKITFIEQSITLLSRLHEVRSKFAETRSLRVRQKCFSNNDRSERKRKRESARLLSRICISSLMSHERWRCVVVVGSYTRLRRVNARNNIGILVRR